MFQWWSCCVHNESMSYCIWQFQLISSRRMLILFFFTNLHTAERIMYMLEKISSFSWLQVAVFKSIIEFLKHSLNFDPFIIIFSVVFLISPQTVLFYWFRFAVKRRNYEGRIFMMIHCYSFTWFAAAVHPNHNHRTLLPSSTFNLL